MVLIGKEGQKSTWFTALIGSAVSTLVIPLSSLAVFAFAYSRPYQLVGQIGIVCVSVKVERCREDRYVVK